MNRAAESGLFYSSMVKLRVSSHKLMGTGHYPVRKGLRHKGRSAKISKLPLNHHRSCTLISSSMVPRKQRSMRATQCAVRVQRAWFKQNRNNCQCHDEITNWTLQVGNFLEKLGIGLSIDSSLLNIYFNVNRLITTIQSKKKENK